MKFLEKFKIPIFVIIVLILMVGGVFFWNYIIKQENKDSINTDDVDVSDANNVPSVDAKLGSDIKITQSYLLSYTVKKSGIWYKSSAYVCSIKIDDDISLLTLCDEGDDTTYLTASINSSKCNVKKGDVVNFVGTIDLEEASISLVKISTEDINYQNVTNISLEELSQNIKLVKETYFVVSGYMITDNDKYKLYSSKSDYNNDDSFGKYFLLNWEEEFNYTGNQDVTVKCLIQDTYKLNHCELQNK